MHCFVSALGLQLWSVRQWDEILTFGDFFKILYTATSKLFRVLKMYFMLDGLTLFRKGDIFVPKYAFRVVFKGGILGGTRQFWGNPYLNSMTVLFDSDILRT